MVVARVRADTVIARRHHHGYTLQPELHDLQALALEIRGGQVPFPAAVRDGDHGRGVVDAALTGTFVFVRRRDGRIREGVGVDGVETGWVGAVACLVECGVAAVGAVEGVEEGCAMT